MKLISDEIIELQSTGPVLMGGRHHASGKIVFPFPENSESEFYERVALKTVGRIWSFTIQRFPPKSPPYIGETDQAGFVPFAIGYVELEDQVIVEARLDVSDFSVLKAGLPVELTLVPFASDPTGEPIHTFAFKPIEGIL